MKLYSALYSETHPFNLFSPDAIPVVVSRPEQLTDRGVLIIWGGEDIHPSLYNRPNMGTHTRENVPSRRDVAEMNLFNAAVEKGMPIFGVCRGAQLACALSGGFLVQDVNGHTSQHYIRTTDGRRILSSSLHHQMMVPWGCKGELLAWADPARSTEYSGITDIEADLMHHEPEVFWFDETRCLAVQGHPEFMSGSCEFNQYMGELWTDYILTRI